MNLKQQLRDLVERLSSETDDAEIAYHRLIRSKGVSDPVTEEALGYYSALRDSTRRLSAIRSWAGVESGLSEMKQLSIASRKQSKEYVVDGVKQIHWLSVGMHQGYLHCQKPVRRLLLEKKKTTQPTKRVLVEQVA